MGNVLFLVLHLIALLFFWPGLFVTIPLHIIYAVIGGRRPAAGTPSPATHVQCPTCKELVHKEATVCRHCGQTLIPASVQMEQQRAARIAAGKRWWQS